jgi:hypothetical protein
MNMNKLNQWLTLAANLGVIAGILFVAVEIQQNNELLEAEARYNHKETRVNGLSVFRSNPDLARIYIKRENGDTLTPEEQVQLDSLWDVVFVSWEWEFLESKFGRIDLPIEGWRGNMLAPGVRERWEERKNIFNEEFMNFMESNIIDK